MFYSAPTTNSLNPGGHQISFFFVLFTPKDLRTLGYQTKTELTWVYQTQWDQLKYTKLMLQNVTFNSTQPKLLNTNFNKEPVLEFGDYKEE